MATEFDLENMRNRLEYYEEKLEEAKRNRNVKEIYHWENTIKGLEEEIRNLEYELKH